MKTIVALVVLLCGLARPVLAEEVSNQPPVPLSAPPPVFPVELKRQQVDGVVIVHIVVNKLGFVEDCLVKRSSRSEFEQPALDAVRNWTFQPARKDGRDVPAEINLPIKFNSGD